MHKPDMNKERHLREVYDGTPMPSPNSFLLASIAGYLIAIAVIVYAQGVSGIPALVLWVFAGVVAILSSLESRLWGWLFDRRFRNRARKAGYTAEEAQWLIENIDRLEDEEDEDF
jgi:hypothetical protein